jgi:pyridoxine 5-phosphate synthase
MAKLSVNINKIATLRNQRPLAYPSPTRFARIALEAGAVGITVHPRPDQRHIRHSDVAEIAEVVRSFPGREYNIEGNPFHHYFPLVEATRPTQCTLVPDDMNQSTSDHGFDLAGSRDLSPLRDHIARLKTLCNRVSLFIDPEPRQIELARSLGVDRVELYTQPYADAFGTHDQAKVLATYVRAAETARSVGLGLNAGHDLTLDNLPPLVSAIPWIDEVSIGHALIADALEFGLAETVKKYIAAAASLR